MAQGLDQLVQVAGEGVLPQALEGLRGGTAPGAVPVLDATHNLTYIDVRILPRTGGKVKIK